MLEVFFHVEKISPPETFSNLFLTLPLKTLEIYRPEKDSCVLESSFLIGGIRCFYDNLSN